MKKHIQKFFVIVLFGILAGCAGIEKRDMTDRSSSETPAFLASCGKPYPVVMDRVDMSEFARYGGAMLIVSQPTLDDIAQKALAKSGCGTTAASWYRVRTTFDVTGKMLGSMCGQQVGGVYGLVMGSYGGRCVNFSSAKIIFTVFDLRTNKDLFVTTAETGTSEAEEIAGGRFLKGIRESGGDDGVYSQTPEGRILAGLVKKGLDALVGDMQRIGLATLDNGKSAVKTADATPERAHPADPAFETFVKSQPSSSNDYVPSKAEKDAARKRKYRNTYAPQ